MRASLDPKTYFLLGNLPGVKSYGTKKEIFMEFKFSEKEEEFYREVEEFLKKELPPDWAEYNRTWPGGYGSNEIRYGAHPEIFLQRLPEKTDQKGMDDY